MIEVKELYKSYGSRRVLDGLSFKIEKGSVTAFLGANGAGKTTTLDIICGCLGKDSGKVILDGKDIDSDLEEVIRNIGYLPEHPPLYGELRVNEALAFVGGIRKIPRIQLDKRIEEILEVLSLDSVKYRLIKNLSKGMRQRLGFAQALLHDPAILILDEPTDGLDPQQMLEFKRTIKGLAQDRTILVSSHNLVQVEDFCDHVVILKEGKVSASGKLQDLLEKLSSTRVYQLQVERNLDNLIKCITSSEFQAVQSGFLRINSSDKETGLMELEMSGEGYEVILDRLVDTIHTNSCGLRLLNWEKRSLEDIYFDITKR